MINNNIKNLVLTTIAVSMAIGTVKERFWHNTNKAYIGYHDITTQLYLGAVLIVALPTGSIVSESYNVSSGWCVAQRDGYSYIVTAGHSIAKVERIIVGYWPGNGPWAYTVADILGVYNSMDIGVIRVRADIPVLPIAMEHLEYNVGDEVIITGARQEAAPAILSIGVIKHITPEYFATNAWAWYGHSGGAVVLRRTNEVIGIVLRADQLHTTDASMSECVDHRYIRKFLYTLDIHP